MTSMTPNSTLLTLNLVGWLAGLVWSGLVKLGLAGWLFDWLVGWLAGWLADKVIVS